LSLFKKKKIYCGIEIDGNMLRFSQVENTNSSFVLKKYQEILLPQAYTKDSNIESIKSFSSLLEQQFGAFKNINFVLGLHGTQIILKNIRLPMLPADEVPLVVRSEADRYLPIPPEEAYIDSCFLRDVHIGNDSFVDALLVAVPRRIVDPFIDSFNRAGLTLSKIDLSILALSRAMGEQTISGIQMVMKMFSEGVNILILDEGYPVYQRFILISYDNLIKNDAGSLELILSEIERTISFYLSDKVNKDIAKLNFVGRSEADKSLFNYIKEKVSVPFGEAMVVPGKILKGNFDENAVKYSGISVGLGMRNEG
jgi:type IV pilus assembly protein PilM